MKQVSVFLQRHRSTIHGVLVLLTLVVVLQVFSTSIAQWLYTAQSFNAVAFLRKYYLAAAVLGGCLVVLLALIWLSKRLDARLDRTMKEC